MTSGIRSHRVTRLRKAKYRQTAIAITGYSVTHQGKPMVC
jgi:hypothetical protein